MAEDKDAAPAEASRKRKAEDISGDAKAENIETVALEEITTEKVEGDSANKGNSEQAESPVAAAAHVDHSAVLEDRAITATTIPIDDANEGREKETSDLPVSAVGLKDEALPDSDPQVKPQDPALPAPTGKATSEPSPVNASSRPKNDYDNLRWIVVRNDGRQESMIKLIGLKSLFAKQLPKMPRAYIARLVLDRRHTSLAILSDKPELKDSDEEIIGGICYRAFPEMRFAGELFSEYMELVEAYVVLCFGFALTKLFLTQTEIAFCAVNATHQVKGYGSKLMNLLKKLAVETGIENFITYADNYAIGYFKKQGFTKSISMPKGRYVGLIKEYDGGTPMECYVHPSIDFTRIPEMIHAQRKYILDRVRLTSNSHRVYEPLPKSFYNAEELLSRSNLSITRAMNIPGIAEAGWTIADLRSAMGQAKETDKHKVALKADLLTMLRRVEEQQFAWPFREPVDPKEVPDYLDVIKEPIDLSTMDKRIRQDNYYRTKDAFFADLILVSSFAR